MEFTNEITKNPEFTVIMTLLTCVHYCSCVASKYQNHEIKLKKTFQELWVHQN